MQRKIGDPRHFLISDSHKGVIVKPKVKKNPMTHLKPKKKKRKK